MNIAEQIAAYEAKRASSAAAMEAIMAKSAEEGETLDKAEQEDYDGHVKDIEAIDGHLQRLSDLQKAQNVTPVEKADDIESGNKNRGGEPRISVRQVKQEPGIQFARVARCKALARLDSRNVKEVAEELYPDNEEVQKAAVPAMSSSHATAAGPLVGVNYAVSADFAEYLRPMTILGKFGADGVSPLRRVPFRVGLHSQTSGGEGYWTGEGKSKALTEFDYAVTYLEPLKVANIAVCTEELLRDSSPSAEMLVRDSLASAIKARLDTDFINPNKSASAGVSPASITNGITLPDASGRTAVKVRDDVRTIFNAFVTANNPPSSGVWVMSSQTALALSLMVNALGQPEFPTINMNGGTFFGLPVITSEYVANYASSPADYTNSYVYLVNAQDIYFADEGGVAVDMSREASLEMVNPGTQSSVSPPVATSMVSMWQTNSVAFRAERTLNWSRRRTSAVAGLKKVQWGQGLS